MAGRQSRGLAIDPAGYDAGKKIKGKKRHLLVDTQGLLMQAIIHAADIQDRDGGVLLMGSLFGLYPFLLKLYADSGYQGTKFQDGLKAACRQINLEIVKRSELHTFVVLPPAAFQRLRRRNLGRLRPSVGSSREPSAGLIAAVACPRTGNA